MDWNKKVADAECWLDARKTGQFSILPFIEQDTFLIC
jgi:hypothetical protein